MVRFILVKNYLSSVYFVLVYPVIMKTSSLSVSESLLSGRFLDS